MTRRLLCLHGHFYQPPRENPWIDEIEVQDSAEPFHDWNERIAAECYGPNAAARVKGPADRIVDIVNNYAHLSFNVGPTLLQWLERFRPEIHARIVEADVRSREARGHGNALAQGYSHSILPLASPRDRLTQLRWGVADFRRRFGRDPEGLWLPETAADGATLAALAGEWLRFTILSPYQARRVRPPGGEWRDATGGRFDPTRPYRVRAGDREVVVFFYDGPIARDVAFGGALGSPEALAARLEGGFDRGRHHDEVLTVAFDGETLGHHRKGGDETMAAALRLLERSGAVEIVNFGQALDAVPAEWEAEIAEGSSWSCAHGIERWRSDCGCQVGAEPGWNQAWRAPLLAALEGLRDRLGAIFEREAAPLLGDPWGARDRYAEVLLGAEPAGFLRREAGRELSPSDASRALRLLEMQRQSLLMFTSCGWFFAEISGLETVQVLKYAARAVQLARDATGVDLEPALESALARAPSNRPEHVDGRGVYQNLVQPSVATLEGVAAHLAISSAVRETPPEGKVFRYRYRLEGTRKAQSGPATLTLGRMRIESGFTGEGQDLLCCVLHFGAADFRCGVAPWRGEAQHADVERVLFGKLESASFARVLREIDHFFPGRDYTLRDLFLDERRRVARTLLEGTLRRLEDHHREIYEDNRRLMEFLRELDSPIPGPLRVAADVTLTGRLLEVTAAARRGEMGLPEAERRLGEVADLARRFDAHLNLRRVRSDAEAIVLDRLRRLGAGEAPPERAAEVAAVLAIAERLGLRLDLWEAQNRLWALAGAEARGAGLPREVLEELARRLWLDPAAVLARAGREGGSGS